MCKIAKSMVLNIGVSERGVAAATYSSTSLLLEDGEEGLLGTRERWFEGWFDEELVDEAIVL